MRNAFLVASALLVMACGGGGDKKTDASSTAKGSSSASGTGSAAPKGDKDAKSEKEPKPAAAVEMVELSLEPIDKSLAGYVMMAPKGAKIDELQIKFGEDDFLDFSMAGGWEDAVKGLGSDKLNENIKKVSDTEYRWERVPPIGRMYMVDVLVKVGAAKWSCNTGLTGPLKIETADLISKMCNSVKKK
jgi:hypothetical protein